VINYLNISYTEPEAPTEPVLLADVKAWANIDHTDDDALLTGMITGARQDIENETNTFLVPKEVIVHAESTAENDIIRLPYGVASSIVVSSIETDETLEELTAGTDYYTRASMYVLPGSTGNYHIAYTAGASVPTALKEAVKMLVAYRYNNRGDQEKQHGLPEDIKKKVEKYQQIWL
jgi:uncharacterized phiE125 gp8 family phage protein